MVYLDNAATTGHKPEGVIRAVNFALKNYSSNPGRGTYGVSQASAEMIYNCRAKIKRLFNCSSEDRVVFTNNCTEAANFVIKGVDIGRNHVIASSLEHNAVARPLRTIEKSGAQVEFAEVIFDDDGATVRSFERLIRPNTRLVICTHASNVTGHILPIKEIGEMCFKNNIPFAVDAAQTAGVVPIDMQKMHIDYLCVAPHKGLYSPMGVGILIAEKDLPKTVIEGGTGTESANIEQPLDFPERMESGTVNVPAIAGVSAGIDFINRVGLEKIYAYELMLAQRFYKRLKDIPGIKIYTPYPKALVTVPTISFNFEGALSSDVAVFLSERNIAVRSGLHCSPIAHKRIGTLDDGTVRVCFSYFNTEYDVEIILRVLRSYKRLLKN